MTVVALDIDLRRIHGWVLSDLTQPVSEGEMLCVNAPDLGPVFERIAEVKPRTVLIECASPVAYRGPSQKTTSWVIHNCACTGILSALLPSAGVSVRVAPSSAWTCSHSAALRHKNAHVRQFTGKEKCLMDCQAMIHYYLIEPEKWKTYHQWIAEL